MKTAKEYLRAAMGCEPVNSRIDYTDALEAVQAAIDDAGSVREQVRQALTDYFDYVLPDPPRLPLPADTPPIRLGQPSQMLATLCPRCMLNRGTGQCICPPMFPREEPPF